MGLILRPAEVKNAANQIKSDAECMGEQFQKATKEFLEFDKNDMLSSEAWGSIKKGYGEFHRTISNAITVVSQSIRLSSNRAIIGAQGLPDDYYDENSITSQIAYLEKECVIIRESIHRFELMRSIPFFQSVDAIRVIESYTQALHNALDMINVLKKKLQLLNEYNTATYEYYDEAYNLLIAVNEAIEAANKGHADTTLYSYCEIINIKSHALSVEMNTYVIGSIRAEEAGKCVGSIVYDPTTDGMRVADIDEGFLKVYDAPTLTCVGQVIDVNTIYDMYNPQLKEMFGEKRYYSGALQAYSDPVANSDEVGPNSNGKYDFSKKEFDRYHGTILCDDIDRYAVAVGPAIQNPNIDYGIMKSMGGEVYKADDMRYGTCIDISLDINDKTYYIPAVIVDVKNHTWPTGICQTGIPINQEEGKKTDYNVIIQDAGNVIEWYAPMEGLTQGLDKSDASVRIIDYDVLLP